MEVLLLVMDWAVDERLTISFTDFLPPYFVNC
jgi:hypothetical protein